MSDNAPKDNQPSEDAQLPEAPPQVVEGATRAEQRQHLGGVRSEEQQDTVKVLGEPVPVPSDLIEPLEPIQDETAMELPPASAPPCLGNQAPLELNSGLSGTRVQTDAHAMHDETENAASIPRESGKVAESVSAAEVTNLQGNHDKDVVADTSVKLKSEDHNADEQNETNFAPDAKDLNSVRSEGSDIHQDDGNLSETKANDDETGKLLKVGATKVDFTAQTESEKEQAKPKSVAGHEVPMTTPNKSYNLELCVAEGYESGTEEEQAAFRKDVENFYRENGLEFKAPKFYKEELNLLKLWRAVIKLGGYEQVTSCKLWRQVGESFRPPKTCTTVSWTFRIFYEKALLEYEKHKLRSGELPFSDGPLPESLRAESQAGSNQALGSGRARRDAAARAMQGWHSQRLLDNGEVCHPIIKDKNLSSAAKVDKQLKTNGAGLLKRKKPSGDEHAVNTMPIKTMKPQSDTMVIDIGPPAEWVKINVQKNSDCFEIYALVPGLLREEVHVQSDPAGRVIISGQPEQLDNPWGITPFKKVVNLPSRIDPHHTSAVVTLHGQLFVRVPFE